MPFHWPYVQLNGFLFPAYTHIRFDGVNFFFFASPEICQHHLFSIMSVNLFIFMLIPNKLNMVADHVFFSFHNLPINLTGTKGSVIIRPHIS